MKSIRSELQGEPIKENCVRRGTQVSFEEVKATFLRDNAATPERNAWPLGALEVANRQFGNWTKVVLTPEEVLAVLLPQHNHGVNLVPAAGSSVSEAISKLDLVDRLTECYSRIQQFFGAITTVVFLSTAPIKDPRYVDYTGLISRGCIGLTHLDGLHRLVAWGWENKRDVPAYVAGLTFGA
jgi:hypothetical protein